MPGCPGLGNDVLGNGQEHSVAIGLSNILHNPETYPRMAMSVPWNGLSGP